MKEAKLPEKGGPDIMGNQEPPGLRVRGTAQVLRNALIYSYTINSNKGW